MEGIISVDIVQIPEDDSISVSSETSSLKTNSSENTSETNSLITNSSDTDDEQIIINIKNNEDDIVIGNEVVVLDCDICYNKIYENDEPFIFCPSCQSQLHLKCLYRWYKNYEENENKCPACTNNIFSEPNMDFKNTNRYTRHDSEDDDNRYEGQHVYENSLNRGVNEEFSRTTYNVIINSIRRTNPNYSEEEVLDVIRDMSPLTYNDMMYMIEEEENTNNTSIEQNNETNINSQRIYTIHCRVFSGVAGILLCIFCIGQLFAIH